MTKMQKDEILDQLVLSEGIASGYSRPEAARTEQACDHWWGPVLLERAAYLRKLARFGEGSASETIREFLGYSIMLSVLLRSGEATMHEEFGHIITVLDGRATLVTGGNLEKARRVRPGEFTGLAISGGTNRELRTGDVVHVGAGIPHQLLIAGDKSISCLMVRIRNLND